MSGTQIRTPTFELATFGNMATARERQECMRVYLQATRPAFEDAIIKSLSLGQAVNGVLAGPRAIDGYLDHTV